MRFQHDAHYSLETSSTASHQASSAVQARRATTPPPERRNSDSQPSARPKTMYVTAPAEEDPRGQGGLSPRDEGDLRAPPRGVGKKRPAPPPPQAGGATAAAAPGASAGDSVKVSVAAPVAATAPSSSSNRRANAAGDSGNGSSVSVSVKPGAEAAGLSRLHSRNSSDSSGYHELTLSGAESPEAARVPTTFKTSIDTTSIESSDNLNGDSGIQELSPVSEGSRLSAPAGEGQITPSKGVPAKHQAQTTHSSDRLEKPKPLPSTKKKKAPPPPPKGRWWVEGLLPFAAASSRFRDWWKGDNLNWG